MTEQVPIGPGQGPNRITVWAQNPDGVSVPVQCDDDGNLIVTNGGPASLTPLANSSGNQANANAVATLHPATGKTAAVSGFQMTATGATGVLAVSPTVTGIIGGPLTYTFLFPAGATVVAQPLAVTFDPPLKATDVDTDIVVTLPASGTGGLHAACSAQGIQY